MLKQEMSHKVLFVAVSYISAKRTSPPADAHKHRTAAFLMKWCKSIEAKNTESSVTVLLTAARSVEKTGINCCLYAVTSLSVTENHVPVKNRSKTEARFPLFTPS